MIRVGHFYSIIPLSAGILLRYQNHSTVVIDEVGLGFEGKDERHVYSTVKVNRHGLSQLLAMRVDLL